MPRRLYTQEAAKFLDLIWNEKIHRNPNLKYDDVAPMLGFDRYRPSLRMCKRNFDLTIVKFFKTCRIEDVKQFLSQPESREHELIDIAHKFGHSTRRYFNESFKYVTGITPREFWFFHEHFVKTTGMTLVEYEQPKTKKYLPEDGKPTFLSNFLNRQADKISQKRSTNKKDTDL